MLLVPIGTIFMGIAHHFDSQESINIRKVHAKKKWETKKGNARYPILISDLDCAEEALKTVENELNTNA